MNPVMSLVFSIVMVAAVSFAALRPSELSARNVTVPLKQVETVLQSSAPGDTVFVAEGIYSDCRLNWFGRGTAERPVVVCPETEGGVTVTGSSYLRLYGTGLEVKGLGFIGGSPARSSLVEFRKDDELAEHCRLTDCVIDDFNPVRRDGTTVYVALYGRHNRVDHCSFLRKKNLGVVIYGILTYEGCLNNHHSIDHNFFGPREVYGSNGAETIRIGTSQQCTRTSATDICDNLFLRCNGEVEVISIKSCDNLIARNAFYESEGVLALRHGDRNIVEDNVFIGNGVRNTGGVRIVGEDQKVRRNMFFGLSGDRFFSALALMNAVPNSLPNRYMQVKNVEIAGNSFVDCASIEFGCGSDCERTLAPTGVLFKSNKLWNESLSAPYEAVSSVSGVKFRSNKAHLSSPAVQLPGGFRPLSEPAPAAPLYGSFREGKGALWYKDKSNCLTLPDKPGYVWDAAPARTVRVSDAAELAAAVDEASDGTEILLAPGKYVLEKGLRLRSRVSMQAEGGEVTVTYAGRESENMITICDGGELYVRGICFDGTLTAGRRLAKAMISTDADMIDTYNLKIEDCRFVNCGEGGFIPVRGLKGTFAHRVEIADCSFSALSGDAINFAAETDDKGRYNADDLIISGCTFERILGIPVNVCRGGSDESTAGPYVHLSSCTFTDCCNKVRGSVVRIIGAQTLHIAGCRFIGSGRGGCSIRLDEAPWEKITLEGLSFSNSGKIISNGTIPDSVCGETPETSGDLAAVRTSTRGQHPTLLLTRNGLSRIKAAEGSVPRFDASVAELLASAQTALERPLCLPEPTDGGGGYSHEMHKQNYYDMYNCGVAWQLTGDRRYADKVKELLKAYAGFYPALGYHPLGLSKTPGRIFWQTLNESVWLVHTSIAYDCVYDFLSAGERSSIEKNLLYPVAEFIMDGTPDNRINNRIFNKMHNHGTWATAAVGMIAIAMGDDELLDKALYGSDRTGQNGGFIRQLDFLFSPDGYFTEGAYYQRYAIWPFVLFAQCISNYRPELDIFGYRDGIILKAVDALLQMAYDGVIMRFNDALEKTYNAQELIYAVDIAYNADRSDKALLSVAELYQDKVLVSDAGYAVAKAIQDGEAEPMEYRSRFFRDGGDGTQGGFAIMRSARPDLNSALTFKATSHGLSHGHYDKLTFAYYDAGNEIITDYGASRFLNIEAKYNGHYTRQNKSYAMSTIAHNTLVADGKSHFDGDFDESSKHWPAVEYVSLDDAGFQVVAAVDTNAVKGVEMRRVLAYADVPFLEYPLIIDLLKAESAESHRYDYPIHYNGQMISLSVPYRRALNAMTTLGEANGYQHLWKEAEAAGGDGVTTYTWLTGYRMYSISTATSSASEVFLARSGANDLDFNLRSEPVYIVRENGGSSHLFASCIETHGRYDLQVEQSANLVHSCESIETLVDNAGCMVVKYGFAGGHSLVFAYAPGDCPHCVALPGGQTLSWDGAAAIFYDNNL